MSHKSLLFSTMFLAGLLACSSEGVQSKSDSEAVPEVVAEGEPSPSPHNTTAVVPAGTTLKVRLAQRLSTRTNQSGDEFEAVLDEDLVVDGRVVVPAGSQVMGRLPSVEEPGKVKGRARMTLRLMEVWVGEGRHPIESSSTTITAESTKGRDAKVVGGGAGVGALIGAIAGGKKGAAIGAATGGGAGTAAVLMTKGEEVNLEAERVMSFRLEKELEVELTSGQPPLS